MRDEDKTREQLIAEIEALQGEVAEQKRAAEALRESEERYRLLSEAIPHPVWRSDAEGRQIDCNRRWQEYTGQTPEEAQGNGWMKALHPDDLAWALQRVREDVPGGKIYQAEYRLRRASDNSFHWHLARAIPRRDADGTILGWFGCAMDIEDLKQAQAALQKAHDELEQRVDERTTELTKANEELAIFRKFADTSGQGFSMADLDGRLIYLNPTLCRMLGEERQEVWIGQHLSICYSEQSNRRGKEEIEPALMRDGYWQGELSMLSRQGKSIPTWQNSFVIRDEQGSPLRLAVVITDITERKRSEEALRQSRDELQSIYDGMADGLHILNLVTRKAVRSNPAMCRLMGYSKEELLSLSQAEAYPPEELPGILERFQAHVEGRASLELDVPMLRKDGSVFYADITTSRIFYDGAPCLICFSRDATERRQAQEALERERQSLWKMLQASDHERQIISYEIHDGLAQYLAAAGMQFQVFDGLRESNPEEAQKAYDAATQLVRQSHAEARRLISEVRPPVIDEIGLETAISHLVHEQRRSSGPKIQFESDLQFDRLPPILENAIYRIVQEALTNACKHSKSKKVTVAMAQEGQDVRLEVRDWGIGFDPEAVGKGHFGLEGIRQRARLLGGRVTIESKANSGTSVRVVVPIVERQHEVAPTSPLDSACSDRAPKP